MASHRKLKLQKEEDIAQWLSKILDSPMLESPIDISMSYATEIELPALVWHNFHIVPKKMKLTNTGYTVILSGKWTQDRPFITGGPLVGPYIFSQLHLHWGTNDMEGSEHMTDGVAHPMELHAIFFKEEYNSHEAALKHRDGVIMMGYMFKLDSHQSSVISEFTRYVKNIIMANSSTKVEPFPLGTVVKEFNKDYLMYWGTIATSSCSHYITWLVCRVPAGLTSDQVDYFRMLTDLQKELISKNFRPIQPLEDRPLFHVCPSSEKTKALLPTNHSW